MEANTKSQVYLKYYYLWLLSCDLIAQFLYRNCVDDNGMLQPQKVENV